jgi:type II secretory pathway pseudopilin PulG
VEASPAVKHRHRNGWTLIELVATMTVATTMFGLLFALIHGFFRLERRSREELLARSSLARLAAQFRDDVHAAQALAPAPAANAASPAGWDLRLDGDWRVEYRVVDEGLDRVERVGDRVERRELYRLPAGMAATVDLPTEKTGSIAVLRIAPDGLALPEPGTPPVRIEAALGFDRRFETKGR